MTESPSPPTMFFSRHTKRRTIELRNSEQYDRLPDLASELARRPVTAMFADTLPAAVAARAATATIPIVFSIGGDPIRDGLVTSLSRPTGNLTGVAFFVGELLSKRLALLRELVPKADLVAVLLNLKSDEFSSVFLRRLRFEDGRRPIAL